MRRHNHGYVISLCQCIERLHHIVKVLWRINIFFTVSTYDEEFLAFQSYTRENIRCLNLWHVIVEHFPHMRTSFNDSFRADPLGNKIPTSMLGQHQIDITQMIEHLTIKLFRNPLIKTAIASLHMKDRDFSTLGGNYREARI